MNRNFIQKRNKGLIPKSLESSKVKIRLAPLPSKSSSYGGNFNLEESLNRSIQTERPLSRLSDMSNFSTSSMIILTHKNDEETNCNLTSTLNKNILEALKKKDLKRKRYFNEDNASTYSFDSNFGTKRKRAYDEEDEDELESLFELKCDPKLMISQKKLESQTSNYNRYVSSKFKNNEILSSYSSINFPQLSSLKNKKCIKNTIIEQANLFKKVPTIKINEVNADSSVNLSHTKKNNLGNLTNSSISPINKKNDSSSLINDASFKTNNSSQSNKENHTLIGSNSSQEKESEHEKDSFSYNFPERFHSIDEHIHDENKAKSRLGLFLKAIFNATSPLINSKKKETLPEKCNQSISTAPTLSNLTNIPVNNSISSKNIEIFKIPCTITDITKSSSNSLLDSFTNTKPTDKFNTSLKTDKSLFNINIGEIKSSALLTATTNSLTFSFDKNSTSISKLTSVSNIMPIMTTESNIPSFNSTNFSLPNTSSIFNFNSNPTNSNSTNSIPSISNPTNSKPVTFSTSDQHSNLGTTFQFNESSSKQSTPAFNFSCNLGTSANSLNLNSNISQPNPTTTTDSNFIYTAISSAKNLFTIGKK